MRWNVASRLTQWIALCAALSCPLPAIAAASPAAGKTAPAAPAGNVATAARTNLLELANGTLVVTASSSYGGSWDPMNLADGSTGTGWCSAKDAPLPHSVVFELPQPHSIASVAVDNTGAQDGGYPGISSKNIEVFGSTTSATAGFKQIAVVEAPRSGRKEVKLAAPATAQWLKFVVTGNWGNAEYTEIMELEAYGAPVGPAPKVSVAGIYQTNYGPMRVAQDGSHVAGCYDYKGGQLSGNLNGRVMQFEWREDEGKRVGSAVMVLSTGGDTLNGVWFERGTLRGVWSGAKGGDPPKCTPPGGGGIAERLAGTGKVVVYGIYFDPDAATLKPESEQTLNEILAALKGTPGLKLIVAGHTDNTNTDAHNLKLSEQRAGAVVAWLVGHGVEGSRLTAKGFGESQPVADNATASGRALNRRVELQAQ